MNRYRLNQILEILLFPVTDPLQGKEDYLLSCYEAYHSFMEESRQNIVGIQVRNQKDREYKAAKKKLVSYLVERNWGKVKSEDDVQMLCELYYPMSEIECKMNHLQKVRQDKMYESINVENISSYYLRSLARISRSLITYRDGIVAIRQWVDKDADGKKADLFSCTSVFNKIEVWNLLCRFTVPDLYIVIAAVENNLGLEALYEQKSNIALADKLLVKSIQKGVAENHLHFNVGFDYEIVWLYRMDLKFAEKVESKEWSKERFTRLQAALFRCLAACYLNQRECDQDFRGWLNEYCSEELQNIIFKLYAGDYEGNVSPKCKAEIYKVYASVKAEDAIRECDYLLDKVYGRYIEYKTSSEFLLLYLSYQYLKQNEEDTFFARIFIQYIRLKNDFFRKLCERNVLQGLKYFQKVYNSAKQVMGNDILPTENMMLEVFRSQAKIANLKKLEIRIAPWVDGTGLDHFEYVRSRKSIWKQLGNQIYTVLNSYRRYILECILGVRNTWEILKSLGVKGSLKDIPYIWEEVRRRTVTIPNLGIVFHFIKGTHLEDISGAYCWKSISECQERQSSYRIIRRLFMKNIAIALEEMRSNIPGLSEYIVGIDAASDENAMEPWMIAPSYKLMRSHIYTKPVLELKNGRERFCKIQNIGFTYHVGEDFRHIISGLRHIDEVLEEFGYKAGDRLGHALALGIDIEQWINDNEVVPIPLLEYMENLLWMWGVNTCEGVNLPIQLEVLEDKILNIAYQLYEQPELINVKMLYCAYKKKFDIDHEEIAKRLLDDSDDACEYCCFDKQRCYDGWTADKLVMTNYCPVYEELYEKVELISVSKDEINVYKRLQEYLVRKVEKWGIFIETNPTSNLTIGDFSHIHRHPIFYLNQANEMGYRVLVTINSDDPAVFNTNIENELAYIYYAAETQGMAKSDILEWIDRIRQYGMDASFVQKEKNTEQILLEIEEIMQSIRKMTL